MILRGQKNLVRGLMDSEIVSQSSDVSSHGGAREGSGAKPEWFKARCRALASSRHFFTFAEKVFMGDPVEPRITRTGIIYTEASAHDKVFLWEKLANYGFGKPVNLEAGSPEKSVESATAALAILKLMQEAQNGNNSGISSASDPSSLDDGRPASQTPPASA